MSQFAALGAHPVSYQMSTMGFFSVVIQPGYEADHSPPSRAKVKNAWCCASILLYVFMAWCSVKHRAAIRNDSCQPRKRHYIFVWVCLDVPESPPQEDFGGGSEVDEQPQSGSDTEDEIERLD
jgi:hypothetical protein